LYVVMSIALGSLIACVVGMAAVAALERRPRRLAPVLIRRSAPPRR
jgi:hypothetical protein